MPPRFANPAAQLAAFRVATYATLLLVVDPRIPAHYAAYPDVLLTPPGFWRDVLGPLWTRQLWHTLVTPELIWSLYAIFVPACVMAMLGFRTRAAQLVTIILGLILLGVAQFYGKVNHYHHLLWFAMLLGVSPGADVLAVDAVRRVALAPSRPRDAYELPLRFVWALLVVIYFFPGLWKLAWVGPAWASPTNVIGILHAKWAETGHVPWLRVDRWPWLCGAIGVATLVFELAFLPLTLAGKWPRRIVASLGVLFHLGIWLAMDIRIGHVLIGYLALIDVSRVFGPRAQGGVRDAPPRAKSSWPRWPVCVVGFALVAGNIYDGVSRREDWPLGMYPAFAWRAPDHHVTLEIVAEFDDGPRRVLTPLDLARYTTPERAAATCLSAIHDDAMRPARQFALWHVWCQLDPSLRNATRVRFERVVRQVKPEAASVEVERRVIGEVILAPD